ncbi:MAG: creatininase family protein [Candidatus Eisenbacteria bacterium]|nr:creatininase family protein [Candidatus Eisenbacteria bacterium]
MNPNRKTIRMEEMNWPDVRAAIDEGYTTVVVGVGSMEQHGPHLPTMTDTRIGDAVAHAVALRLGHALLAHTIPVGVSAHHLAFGATVSLRRETLKMIVCDYVDSLVRDGFTRIIFLPSHGGNFAPLAEAAGEARAAHPEIAIVACADLDELSEMIDRVSGEFGVTPGEAGMHAGENETSLMLALEPELVVRERFAPGYLGKMEDKEIALVFEQGMPALTKNGVLGDPAKASAEKGRIYLEKMIEYFVSLIG